MLTDYLKGRETEVIDIMIMLFDQEYAVEQYGRAQKEKGRAEGREEGRIMEAVLIFRNEMHKSDDEIRTAIMKRFSLTMEEAMVYVPETKSADASN